MTNEREANDEERVTKKEREIRELANLEISKLTWVRRKKSVACATEILQIFKKIKQIGNKLPKNLAQITRIARIVFHLTIDNW